MQVVAAAGDHRLTHLKGEASDFEMYLYTGRYKDTFVMVSSAWHPSMVQQPEGHSAHVLRDMQKIRMDKGPEGGADESTCCADMLWRNYLISGEYYDESICVGLSFENLIGG